LSEPWEISETSAKYEVSEPAPVTYDQAEDRYSPGTHAARDRHYDLSCRDHLGRTRG
jgi:hypothetical protein